MTLNHKQAVEVLEDFLLLRKNVSLRENKTVILLHKEKINSSLAYALKVLRRMEEIMEPVIRQDGTLEHDGITYRPIQNSVSKDKYIELLEKFIDFLLTSDP